MKKIALLTLIILGAALPSHAACNCTIMPKNTEVIDARGLANEQLEQWMLGKLDDVIVAFSAGTTLPVTFELSGNLLALTTMPIQLQIKQTIYSRCESDKKLFSINLVDWKPLNQFITGNISVSLEQQQGELAFGAFIEVNTR